MRKLVFASVACALAMGFWSGAARADEDGTTYEKKDVTGPQYTAPLFQRTQPSYVPQSVALSGPTEISDWSGKGEVPAGYTPVEKSRRGLLIAGACVFGTLYMFSLLAGTSDSTTTPLLFPVLGPFLQIAAHGSSDVNGILLVDGIGQAAGAIMLLVGATTTKTVLIRNDLAEVRIAPVVTKTGSGLGLVGTF